MPRTHYEPCPNGCDGEAPCIWDPVGNRAVIDNERNARSHDDGCPTLTEVQREAVMNAATVIMSQIEFWYDEP